MPRIAIFAVALLASTAAQAGESYNFRIGGQTIQIDQPRGCNAASCVSVSIPGVYESGPRRRHARDAAVKDGADSALTSPKPVDAAAAQNAASPVSAERSVEPANGAGRTPANEEASPPPAPGGLAAPVMASLPAATPAPAPAAATSPNSPIGTWLTEEKDGKVRIESCGANLCGYAIDKKTDRHGDQVLINMKPVSGKWSGRIHDPDSGSRYDSTIAMTGADRLRVQGCAFGGMVCGGQTWTRVN